MNKEAEKLKHLYGQLGQVLDGVWFMAVEEIYGFEKAFEIDNKVWEIYGRKEAGRIQRMLGIDSPQIHDLETFLSYSIFNSSLRYHTEIFDDSGSGKKLFRFIVDTCKTLDGMQKVGRSEEQIFKICKEVGLTFFGAFIRRLFPDAEIQCKSCPYHEENDSMTGKNYVCIWDFIL